MASIKCFSDIGLTPAISLQPICAPDKRDESQMVTGVETKRALSAPKTAGRTGLYKIVVRWWQRILLRITTFGASIWSFFTSSLAEIMLASTLSISDDLQSNWE